MFRRVSPSLIIHTPLPRVVSPDKWYDTKFNISFPGNSTHVGWDGRLLNMTSGSWMKPTDSSAYIWTHHVLVVVPSNLNPAHYDYGILYITGGDNGDGPPGAFDEDVLLCVALATEFGVVCSVLYQVPNQPVYFSSDPNNERRSEDAAVAWTWREYMLHNASSSWTTPDSVIYYPSEWHLLPQ